MFRNLASLLSVILLVSAFSISYAGVLEQSGEFLLSQLNSQEHSEIQKQDIRTLLDSLRQRSNFGVSLTVSSVLEKKISCTFFNLLDHAQFTSDNPEIIKIVFTACEKLKTALLPEQYKNKNFSYASLYLYEEKEGKPVTEVSFSFDGNNQSAVITTDKLESVWDSRIDSQTIIDNYHNGVYENNNEQLHDDLQDLANQQHENSTSYHPYKKAIITAAKANVRSGPDTSYKVIHTAVKGAKAVIHGIYDGYGSSDWYYGYIDGVYGYISKSLVTIQ